MEFLPLIIIILAIVAVVTFFLQQARRIEREQAEKKAFNEYNARFDRNRNMALANVDKTAQELHQLFPFRLRVKRHDDLIAIRSCNDGQEHKLVAVLQHDFIEEQIEVVDRLDGKTYAFSFKQLNEAIACLKELVTPHLLVVD